MALQTFTPVPAPTYPLDAETVTRSLNANFGDGYTQRGADGLNASQVTYSLTWENLTDAEADTIIAFFLARGGYEAFYWTPPTASPLKFVVQKWSRSQGDYNAYSLKAMFIQVFDL